MRKEPKLLDQVRSKIRIKHYARTTEKTYIAWIKRYILFHQKRHPKDMAAYEIEAFLSHFFTVPRLARDPYIYLEIACNQLMSKLFYGAGLLVMGYVGLRVKNEGRIFTD